MSTRSAEIKDLAAALCKVQAVLHGAVKDSSNPYFNSKYADLESVWNALRKPLTENGLAVIQTTDVRCEKIGLVTTLVHSTGQWVEGFYPLNPVKNDPQAHGSAMTYARRYALAAICGVVQVDDDGESAMQRPTLPSGRVAPLVRPEQPCAQDGDPNAKHEFRMRVGAKRGRGLEEIERELGGIPAMQDWFENAQTWAEKQLAAGKLTGVQAKLWKEDLVTVANYIGRRETEMEKDFV